MRSFDVLGFVDTYFLTVAFFFSRVFYTFARFLSYFFNFSLMVAIYESGSFYGVTRFFSASAIVIVWDLRYKAYFTIRDFVGDNVARLDCVFATFKSSIFSIFDFTFLLKLYQPEKEYFYLPRTGFSTILD